MQQFQEPRGQRFAFCFLLDVAIQGEESHLRMDGKGEYLKIQRCANDYENHD